MQVTKGKATTAQLDELHNVVAGVISAELTGQIERAVTRDEETGEEKYFPGLIDTKLLGQAIKFLKDNDITAEVLESDKIRSIAKDIKVIANKENELEDISVEDMLDIANRTT